MEQKNNYHLLYLKDWGDNNYHFYYSVFIEKMDDNYVISNLNEEAFKTYSEDEYQESIQRDTVYECINYNIVGYKYIRFNDDGVMEHLSEYELSYFREL